MQYRNLTLVRSSHISSEAVNDVKEAIETQKPGIIAVELDQDRLSAMFHPGKRTMFVRGVGLKGMLFAFVAGWLEHKMGKIVNVELGSEMKTAVNLARKNNIKLALIDQHIKVTLRRFSESITWKEKWNFVVDILSGIFTPKKQLKELGIKAQDLTKVPTREVVVKVLNHTKKRYPNFYNVIVHERNVVMAKHLAALMKAYPDENIVAVVGAGHEEGIMKILREKLYKDSKV